MLATGECKVLLGLYHLQKEETLKTENSEHYIRCLGPVRPCKLLLTPWIPYTPLHTFSLALTISHTLNTVLLSYRRFCCYTHSINLFLYTLLILLSSHSLHVTDHIWVLNFIICTIHTFSFTRHTIPSINSLHTTGTFKRTHMQLCTLILHL